MLKRSRKKNLDINQIAKYITNEATEGGIVSKAVEEGKNPAAVLLGRLGGLKGGKARAKKLSAGQRSDIAKRAAEARWKNHKK